MRVDSLSAAADTTKFPAGAVMAQTPAAEAELKGTKEIPDTARLVVQKSFSVVPPDLVNITPVNAANKMVTAGLFTSVRTQSTDSVTAARGLIIRTIPESGTLVARGDSVAVFVGSFCSRSNPRCNIRVFIDMTAIERINRGIRVARPNP